MDTPVIPSGAPGPTLLSFQAEPRSGGGEESPDASFVAFGVRDTGAGIPAGDLPNVFERFYRADPARARRAEARGSDSRS